MARWSRRCERAGVAGAALQGRRATTTSRCRDRASIRGIENDEVAGVLGDGAALVGGTAWVFSREELAGAFDYLFIDEAGQFSLANAVAVGQAARNLVLVGDQMQLAQVTQGTHPGETGLSCLEYLPRTATPPSPPSSASSSAESRRMHPDVCRFISEAIYEGRLDSIPETARHRVLRAAETALVPAETGIVWLPVEHDGCTQSSDEECDAIAAHRGRAAPPAGGGPDGVERADDAGRHPRSSPRSTSRCAACGSGSIRGSGSARWTSSRGRRRRW